MDIDKRLKQRLETDLELTIQHSGKFHWSSLRNLSGGGVFVCTDEPQALYSMVSMQIKLPGDPEIMDVEGRVVWTKQGSNARAAGMGIEFTSISVAHQEKITDYVQEHLTGLREKN